MIDWRETSNGNFIHELESGDLMTVFERDGLWTGVHDDCFTEEKFKSPEKAQAVMERAVIDGTPGLLIRHRPQPRGWKESKKGGFHCLRSGCMMTVKRAASGSWYLVVGQKMVEGKWFQSARDAMAEGDRLIPEHGF